MMDRRCAQHSMVAGAVLCAWLAAGSTLAATETNQSSAFPSAAAIPDFSGFWQHGVAQIVFQPLPDGGPSPVIDVLDIPCTPNCPPRSGGQAFVGDYSNPILRPGAAAAVRRNGDLWRSDNIVNAATELCAPSGVPHITTVFGPVQFLQTPDMVTILYQRDHQIRRVYLNRGHSVNLVPSWYGESVGHYEGETFVVDTIGLNDRSIVDRFGAPQTESIHVIERYRVINDGRALLAHVTVEDQNSFTTAWSGTITYDRNGNVAVLSEVVCAENNRDPVTKGLYPIPTARDGAHPF